MSWALLVALVLILGLSLFAAASRRNEIVRMGMALDERDRAEHSGSREAQLSHPVVDLSRCLGCATCVASCPEDGVLEIVHGQAMVVNGARCVGVSACERECPVGAVTVTIANLEQRDDVPAVDSNLEAVGAPGLFLAGEVTAQARIKTALEHGTFVADEVARRQRSNDLEVLDLVVVGAGPAGLACSLQAASHDLRHIVVDQESSVGGTVAKYPRRKLVLTEPVQVPHAGRLERRSYTKEEIVDMWQAIAVEESIPLRGGETLIGVERDEEGIFTVRTDRANYRARYVCLAIGRRGSPRRLGVPGEERSKVTYALLDAQAYEGRRCLVVGGGDSAVEAALALAEQKGTTVTLSYRKAEFVRIRARNEARLREAVEAGTLHLALNSHVLTIDEDSVALAVQDGAELHHLTVPNDDVFVMVGGTPPVQLLQRAGVSFDPNLRPPPPRVTEQGTGLSSALRIGFVLSLGALLWAAWHGDYYLLPASLRPEHPNHQMLRPNEGLGFAFGVIAAVLVGVNLLYLWRRAPGSRLKWGSLTGWMTSHVATGILAFLCALLHSAMAAGDTVGGHTFWALAALLVTGAVGRYLYSYVPRAANGRELALAEAKNQLERAASRVGGRGGFGESVREEVFALVDARQWHHSLPRRFLALLGVQLGLRRVLRGIELRGAAQGLSANDLRETLDRARAAHRSALMVAHYEDLRALANTWRWLHRWMALLMVLLLLVHIAASLIYDVHGGL